ncbi:MAG: 4-hydroxy-tetrahydrodipicolinate reductase [Alphaproteobacteria bacterium]|nr:4-hydroxy-tetrahydrodipicolinate reductase [Alphaproteobacteria bacterium]
MLRTQAIAQRLQASRACVFALSLTLALAGIARYGQRQAPSFFNHTVQATKPDHPLPPLRVALIGAHGRMGRTVSDIIHADYPITANCPEGNAAVPHRAITLVRQIVRAKLAGDDDTVSTELTDMAPCDVAIDVTNGSMTPRVMATAMATNTPIVSAVTGLNPTEFDASVRQAATRVPVFHADNFALGVHALRKILAEATEVLLNNPHLGYHDVEILDIHHRHKVDAPSGTALKLGQTIEDALRPDRISQGTTDGVASAATTNSSASTGSAFGGGRYPSPQRTPDTRIGYAAQRGGEVIGEHEVTFFADTERLTIAHRVADRRVFAAGVVRAALFLATMPRDRGRLYGVDDLFAAAPAP